MMNIYLEELLKEYPDKDILIILDQARWHKAKDLKVPQNVTLMFLPPYSPELNPVEKLWKWLRKEVTHNNLFKTLEALMDALEKEFRKMIPQEFMQLCHCSYLGHIMENIILVREMWPSDFIWLTDQERMFSHGLSAEIWVRGGRQDAPPESILGSHMACKTPSSLLSHEHSHPSQAATSHKT